MEVIAVTEAVKLLDNLPPHLTEADKAFVVQFAFRTGDNELTNKLIDELCMPEKDNPSIFEKYQTMVDVQPEWIIQIEELLIALEKYRMQEEKAIQTLAEILTAYGIAVPAEEIKNTDIFESKSRFKKKPVYRRGVDLTKIKNEHNYRK